MKNFNIALVIIASVFLFNTALAQEPQLVLKANLASSFATSEGHRLHTIGPGAMIEKYFGFGNNSFFFTVHYMQRTDEVVEELSGLDDIWHYSLGFRHYFEKRLSGLYGGISYALGWPSEPGVTNDLCCHVGYQLIKGKFAMDFNTQLGIGHFKSGARGSGADLFFHYSGIVFRTGLGIGIGL